MGIGLGVILALAALLIITNTVRLALLARRDELEILWLVGASRSFMHTPFLLEGLLQGAVGGVAGRGAALRGCFVWCCPASSSAWRWCWAEPPRFFAPG